MKRASEKENTLSNWLAKRGKQETFICLILNYRILFTDETVTLWLHSAIETHEACADKAPDILKFGLSTEDKTDIYYYEKLPRCPSDSRFMLYNHTVYSGATKIYAAMYCNKVPVRSLSTSEGQYKLMWT